MELITDFILWLKDRPLSKYYLVTQNGKLFDVPFVLGRIAQEAELCDTTGIWLKDYEHFDLIDVTQKRTSLQTKAELLGCTAKSGTGKNAIKLWNEGKLKELKEYCMQDVDTTEEVFQKWKELQKQ